MRRIRNKNIAQLLMQLRFTPEKHRRKQLEASENLLAIIDRGKEYPFDFVCFRITGFHPKTALEEPLIKGDELAEDLRIFIAKLSGRLADPANEQGQKVYTIEELANTAGVSTKTVDRWRKRGLIARKFVFGGGRKRLGFLQSQVDRFLADNPTLVAKARRFVRLSDKEKLLIIKQASVLAARSGASRHRVISEVAKKLGRAHETVRYIILNYEKADPANRVFNRAPGVIDPAQTTELHRLYKEGCRVGELMARFGRSRSSIYRLINQRRAKTVLAHKVEFIASDEFLQENAKGKILAKPLDLRSPAVNENTETFELAGELLLPEYLQILKNTPVLDRERELELFRRYNYLKYLACITRAGINPARVSSRRLNEIEEYLAEAEKIKKLIIEANLRLVVGIAVKHTGGGANLSDLISEGNVSLMRAVEKFDYTRGVRFGTHASWAIAKDYARKLPGEMVRLDRSRAAALGEIYRDLRATAVADVAAVERAQQSLTELIKNNLDQREQYVIFNHFGLLGPPVKKKKKTLKQIGDDLGLTKERVRQIELVALQKLRQSLSPEQFDLLTG